MGKTERNPESCLLFALERNATDFHRELSRLPLRRNAKDLALSGRLIFAGKRRLLFADLIASVAADSDLTSLQTKGEAP